MAAHTRASASASAASAALAAAAAAAAGAALDPDATEAAVAAILGRRGLRHALAGVAATSLEGYVSAKAPFARGAFRAEAGAWTRTDGAADADAARADARGRQARRALDELRAGEEPAVEFVEGDLFGAAAVARWRGAAVVLANVLLFGAADKARLAALLGEALRPGAWVLSTAPLADARLARRQEGVHVKTSWTGGAKVDVYQVVGAP